MADAVKELRALEAIAVDVLRCAYAHEADACVVGNVTALELARLAASRITACPGCGAEPWVNIDCGLCLCAGELERPACPDGCGCDLCIPPADDDGDVDDEAIVPRGAIPPYIGCGMWLEDDAAGTGEWLVREIFDTDDGCMARLERAGAESWHIETGQLRKTWRLTRAYDPQHVEGCE